MALSERAIIMALTEIASKMVESAKDKAKWSSTIPGAIRIGTAQKTSTGYYIDMWIDTKEAPSAYAFEFGSGLHATRGTKAKYIIRPKNPGNLLYFHWTPSNFIGALYSRKVADYYDDTDLWAFKYVEHPGVAQKAFMRPAIAENLAYARGKINSSLRALLIGGKSVEVIT